MDKTAPTTKPKSDELMTEAKNFFEFHKKELGEEVKKGKKVIHLDFSKLTEFSNKLAEEILTNPEETIGIVELALEETGLVSNVKVRLINLSKSQEIKIRNIRSKNLNEMIVLEGIIRQASDVRPQVVNAKFECPSCGTIISVLQMEKKFREPMRCSCGRRGGFKLISKEMVDTQRIVIEEAPESLSGGEQPKRINAFLKEDLVEPKMEEKTTPGSRVKVIGTLKEVPVPLQSGGLSTRFELAIEVNNIIPMEETFEELDISEEDERQILELSRDPQVFDKLTKSIIPSVWGYEEIKQSLVLQLFGGVSKTHADGQKIRGDLHILLIGDPGVAKSATLGFMANISPKGRYVVGKSASGAGLTATVVRDEYLRGWSLEAGAMVLANKGLVCIDELEKMDPNDRSAMHEAMEQQCVLPDFKLMLSDGKEVEIGPLVDKKMSENKDKILKGKNCEILPVKDIKLLSTDFERHFPLNVDRISRHKAPKKLIKIEISNGQEITVTPEHPCWVIKDGKISTIPAEKLRKGMHFPIPSLIKIESKPYKKKNDLLCKVIGYYLSTICNPIKKGIETPFCNNDLKIIEDYKQSLERYFKIDSVINKEGGLYSLKISSKESLRKINDLSKKLSKNYNEQKIPEEIVQLPPENLRNLLRAIYDGGGSLIKSKKEGYKICLISSNKELEKQLALLLLRFGIQSSISKNKKYWELHISGKENLLKFEKEIGFSSITKKKILEEYLKLNKNSKIPEDDLPNCNKKIIEILKELNIPYKNETENLKDLNHQKDRKFIQKILILLESYAKKRNDPQINKEISELKKVAFGYANWSKIKKVSKIINKKINWVYDVTIEPHKTFISNRMILHNTITISKANVQATLRAETSVLAAANPKFGRFDPYQPIAQQIDLPPTLINRFDVIFPLRDLPDRKTDEHIATHVLNAHQNQGESMMIPKELFRKYVAYTKQKINPALSDEAVEEIKKFYVELRNMPVSSEGSIRPIPISARQLQALIRMSEAAARMRLSEVVAIEDAKRAIEIMKYYLTKVGYDYESKTFDIDRGTGGMPASQRNKVFIVRDTITNLENKIGKMIPLEELQKELEGKLTKDEIEEALTKLDISGAIFKPKRGYVART
ncbi:hypothetical protein K0A97_00225 [Patescibacteria group bacterium]|nr:hypothetical protein [Patescibacteria group bacterium]